MDILRNKTQTRKVSNQQHIFQKMADPILYMSLRLPSNCWCADPSLIWCCFLQPGRSFSRLFLSFTNCDMGLNWINANKMSQWSSIQHLEDMRTRVARLQMVYMRQKRRSIVSFWHLAKIALSFNLIVMCGRKKCCCKCWFESHEVDLLSSFFSFTSSLTCSCPTGGTLSLIG